VALGHEGGELTYGQVRRRVGAMRRHFTEDGIVPVSRWHGRADPLEGRDVEVGNPGEILLRGPNIFAGYPIPAWPKRPPWA
jgi:hypothetical protein